MSTTLSKLDNRTITDTGEVVFSYDLLLEKALSGEPFHEYLSHPHYDVELYNNVSSKKIKVWEDGGEGSIQGPPEESYHWLIPKYYQDLDIEEYTIQQFSKMEITDESYINRLVWELERIKEHNMSEFFKCLIFITDKFKKNNIVWGVGRGSSCASLVLYVLGINRIDPVKHNISPEEFFRYGN